MADTSIEWTDFSFNPWSGCTKVSAGCTNCYAEVIYSVKMRGVKWGPKGNRIVKAESGWKEPLKWDRWARDGVCLHCQGRKVIKREFRELGDEGIVERTTFEPCETCRGTGNVGPYRARVFCASLADVFEGWQGPMLDASGGELRRCEKCNHWADAYPHCPKCNDWTTKPLTMNDVRARLFALIDATPNLDWLLLTKRPENFKAMLPWPGWPRKNVWLGISVENQQAADERIPLLLQTPATVRFLSCEPLLGQLNLNQIYEIPEWVAFSDGVHWAIVGGESGPRARPLNVAWVRSIVEQCKAAGVACFVKQVGSQPYEMAADGPAVRSWGDSRIQVNGEFVQIHLRDKKGGSVTEWPEVLRVRQFPKAVPA